MKIERRIEKALDLLKPAGASLGRRRPKGTTPREADIASRAVDTAIASLAEAKKIYECSATRARCAKAGIR